MKQNLASGLGGASSPNPSSYGQAPLPPVCWHMRSLAVVSLLFFFIYLASPTMGMAAQSSPPLTAPQPQKTPKALASPTSPPSINPKAASPKAASRLPAKGKARTKGSAQKNTAPHADSWAFSTQKPRPVDSIWTQGMAPQALKNAAVSSLKDKAITTGLAAPAVPPVMPPKPQVPKQNLQNKSRGMQLRGDVDSINSGWHSSGLKNNLRIDQDMNRLETNIYGAYADIEAGDDLTLSAGPEFSHTRTQSATHSSSHTQTDTGSLGLGFHLKWDF